MTEVIWAVSKAAQLVMTKGDLSLTLTSSSTRDSRSPEPHSLHSTADHSRGCTGEPL